MGFFRRFSGSHALGARAEMHVENIQPPPQRTPLGVCRGCSAIVYTGDTLAMAGGYLLHGECCAASPPSFDEA